MIVGDKKHYHLSFNKKETVLLNILNKIFPKQKNDISVGDMIPKPWYVHTLGQNIVHMLWYCQLIDFNSLTDDNCKEVKMVFTEEHDTLEEALLTASSKIHNKDFIIKNKEDLEND